MKVDLSRVLSRADVAAALPVKTKSPWQRLKEIDWLAEPNLSAAPPQKIPSLQILPEANNPVGAIFKAINQLLGYLVAYQPRLFLAAIVAGAWVGWSWHRRLQRLAQYSAVVPYDVDQTTDVRRAA
jgi:hypothetical protein